MSNRPSTFNFHLQSLPLASDRRAGDRLRGVVDASLAGCVMVVPFLMGGRHPLGEAVLVALSVTAAIAWAAGQALSPRPRFRPTWLTPLLLAGAALLLVQATALPQFLLAKVSPKIAELLPLWHAGGDGPARLGAWQTVSLEPAATRSGLVLFLAYALLFVVTVQRIRCLEDVERLLRWTALAAALTALFALVQFFGGNGKYFWIYEHPYLDASESVKANFTNRNHFAQFLALGVGPMIWWAQDAFRRNASTQRLGFHQPQFARQQNDLKAYLLALLLGLLLFAGLLSLSRGGIAALVLASTLAAAVCYRAWAASKAWVAVLAIAGTLAAVSLNIFGFDRVSQRLASLSSCSLERLDYQGSRRSIWTAVCRAIPEFAATGSGVGTHAEVYPIYYSNELYETDTEFTHAENSYLQVGLEAGYPGLILVAGVMACCGVWCIGGLMRARSPRVLAALGAVSGGLAANAVHAGVDFIWYVPACTTMVVVLVACAARLFSFAGHADDPIAGPALHERQSHRHAELSRHESSSAQSEGWTGPRLAYAASVAVLLWGGGWMVTSCVPAVLSEPAWDRYRILRREMDRNPGPPQGAAADAAYYARARKAEERRIELLETVLRWNPDHARAHLDLAECYLRLFDTMQIESQNPMSLSGVRDAAQRSRFASREALNDWLRRAVGEHAAYLDRASRHVRRALALSPLQGRGYLYLAELCFLDSEKGDDAAKKAYIDQALCVRPFDGEVLYAAAREALLAGDRDRWLQLAQQSFRCGRRHQKRLIADLLSQTHPDGLAEMIEFVVREFRPDVPALRDVHASARQRARPEQLVWLRRYYADAAEAEAKAARGEAAAHLWNEARELHAELGDPRRALACAQRAMADAPNCFDSRYALAVALMDDGRVAEAYPHLYWCLQQRPNDAALEKKWKEALNLRLDQQHESMSRRVNQQHY